MHVAVTNMKKDSYHALQTSRHIANTASLFICSHAAPLRYHIQDFTIHRQSWPHHAVLTRPSADTFSTYDIFRSNPM